MQQKKPSMTELVTMACMSCGATENVGKITNRNGKGNITAEFYACRKCQPMFMGKQINISIDEKPKSSIVVPQVPIVPSRLIRQ